MTNPEIEEIVRGLTKAQIDAITNVARFLDAMAGEGIGQEIDGETLWADDLVLALANAFGIEWDGDFGLSVRDHIMKEVKP